MEELINQLTHTVIGDWIALLILFITCAADFVTGIVKAYLSGNMKSHTMKVGGAKKVAEIVCYGALCLLGALAHVHIAQFLLIPAILGEATSIWENYKAIKETKTNG